MGKGGSSSSSLDRGFSGVTFKNCEEPPPTFQTTAMCGLRFGGADPLVSPVEEDPDDELERLYRRTRFGRGLLTVAADGRWIPTEKGLREGLAADGNWIPGKGPR